MSQPTHPGSIVYVDGATQKETRRVPVSEVPDALQFAPTEHGLVPVVRVEVFLKDDKRYIREYGPGGELLRSTMQLRDPS